jgi:hypothetical protein
MAVAGLLFGVGMYIAASKVISMMGGDPEGDVADEVARYQGLTALQQQAPLHKMRQRTEGLEMQERGARGQMADFGIQAREIALGRRVTGSRELLEQVAQRLGTTPEGLSKRVSPMRMGDHSSLSKAAFGRSAKKMKAEGQGNG